MSITYTTADKSLWDDSELIRLYEEQLQVEKQRPLSQHMEITSSVFNAGKADAEQEESGSNESSSPSATSLAQSEDGSEETASSASRNGVEKTKKKPQDRHHKNQHPDNIMHLLLNSSGSGGDASGAMSLASTPPALWGEIAPVLQAFYQAGFAAGCFCSAARKKEKRKRSRS